MKITASNTQLVQQKVDLINTIVDQPQKADDRGIPSFSERLNSGLEQVAQTQNEAAQLASRAARRGRSQQPEGHRLRPLPSRWEWWPGE